ncbi:hypothetical protein M501DRAFT_935013 [Patellaria atrata CBS 101060]|uniref:SUN domain-containing protein n=1 Tax=Patellaria atrata CBS 101060 TaxID=1346257 RepID=A0A9P4VPI9_9PEZI|nr:hypothetical protein M501DRAFT_935013 [Patellaria atrata CBS 101060]
MEPIGRAQIGILLPNPVYPEYLTIEHIPKPETLDIKAAPRVVQLWGEVFSAQSRADIMAQLESSPGWVREDCTNPPSPNYVCLGVFRYNAMFEAADDPPRKKHIQSFKLDVDLASIDVSIKAAVVRVLHNYGQIYTCLYRLRLHGQTIATT